jgi:hypothetical protein
VSLASAQQQQHPAHMQQQFTYTDGFEFLRCGWDSASGQIGHIELNRPAASNAFNTQLWEEFPKVCGGVAPPGGCGAMSSMQGRALFCIGTLPAGGAAPAAVAPDSSCRIVPLLPSCLCRAVTMHCRTSRFCTLFGSHRHQQHQQMAAAPFTSDSPLILIPLILLHSKLCRVSRSALLCYGCAHAGCEVPAAAA